ncbi:hypothetical protein H072_8208 [Dactylellina haptotyla CBS 200.50]|uniref:MATE efflux family protein n=1 Tax=Dactylellina haptotyla (strain CBS 200.50) TaxID=1284197 RepID=S8A4W5_DACHA|nr:hypothetical protein H072_8208 [Dactylellina haptotyla CBS 200.50]
MSALSKSAPTANYTFPNNSPFNDTDDEDIENDARLAVPFDPDLQLGNSYRRRASVVCGSMSTRSALISSSPLPPAYITSSEREQMIEDERSLLRDNHILPRKRSIHGLPWQQRHGAATEEDPLLPQAGSSSEDSETLAANADPTSKWKDSVEAGKITTTWQRETKVLARYSGPLIVTFLLQYSLTVASVFSVGKLGTNELAAVSLASMTSNITGYTIYQGLATSLDTLCSQAYGSGKKKLVGLHMQRCFWFLMLITIPIVLVWESSEYILRPIVPEPELCRLAGGYLRVLAIGAPGYAAWEVGKRFVQAQGIFSASTYILLICAPINALLNYLLVWHPVIGFGFLGAPTAVVITNWLMPLMLFLYVALFRGSECWGGFSKKAWKNWSPMIKLALPGLVMILSEFVAFELLTLAASYLSTKHLAAQSVLATCTSVTFQIPFALSIATSTRVANFLGATLGDAAKTSSTVALWGSTILGIANVTLLTSTRHDIGKLFSNDADVIKLVADSIPICALFQLWDSLAATAGGILRGQGRQRIGAWINLAAYYILALPFSFYTAFKLGWGLFGLWSGVSISLLLVAIIETIIVMRTKWHAMVSEARERLREGE